MKLKCQHIPSSLLLLELQMVVWFWNLSLLFGSLWVFKCGFMLWDCTSWKLSSDLRHILKLLKASSLQNVGQSNLAFVTGKKVYSKFWISIMLFACIIHTVLFTYFILWSCLTCLTRKGLHAWISQVLWVPSDFFELSKSKNVMCKIYFMCLKYLP